MTYFKRTRRPPNERNLLFQLDNLEVIVFKIGFQKSNLQGSPPIGNVTPTADERRGVIAGAQGMTISDSRQLIEEPNHIGMIGILRPCRYETTWLKEGL
jgi:hypothetical protein